MVWGFKIIQFRTEISIIFAIYVELSFCYHWFKSLTISHRIKYSNFNIFYMDDYGIWPGHDIFDNIVQEGARTFFLSIITPATLSALYKFWNRLIMRNYYISFIYNIFIIPDCLNWFVCRNLNGVAGGGKRRRTTVHQPTHRTLAALKNLAWIIIADPEEPRSP